MNCWVIFCIHFIYQHEGLMLFLKTLYTACEKHWNTDFLFLMMEEPRVWNSGWGHAARSFSFVIPLWFLYWERRRNRVWWVGLREMRLMGGKGFRPGLGYWYEPPAKCGDSMKVVGNYMPHWLICIVCACIWLAVLYFLT